MNLVSPRSGHESMGNQQSPEPHVARRAVRYTAAKNATQAIQRQFPGLFVAQVATQAATQSAYAQLSEDSDGYASQTA